MAKHKMSDEDAYLKLRDLEASRRIELGEVAEVLIVAVVIFIVNAVIGKRR